MTRPRPDHAAITTPAATELTDELAEVLTTVAASPAGYYLADEPGESSPADNALTAHDRRRAEQKRAVEAAALSVLQQLGLILHADGYWFVEPAGCEALAARDSAREAARRKVLADSYAAVVAEFRRLADAIDAMTVDGLAALRVEVAITTVLWEKTPEIDAAKRATVDAIATAVLGKTGFTEETSQDWLWYQADSRNGPVHVHVRESIADPKVHERDSEVERLRAELAELRAERDGGAA